MSAAARHSLRTLGFVLGVGIFAAIVLGVAFAIAQDESVLRWIAYMLYIAGAAVIGFGFLAGQPASPRKLARQRTIARAEARAKGLDPDEQPEAPAERTFGSEVALLAVAGAALFAAGILLESVA